MSALKLSLLGPIEIEFQNKPFSGAPHDKSFMLLAYLAVERNRPHSREALADMLWPDLPAERGRHNLRQTVFRLRSLLGNGKAGDFVETDRHRIWFNRDSDYLLDLEHFHAERADGTNERLLERLGYYRGTFMEDLRGEVSEDFDLWLEERRAQTHRLMLDLLESVCTHYEAQGDLATALHWAGRQVEIAPWDEHGHQRLIRLLADSGQRNAAIRHYRAMAESLNRELGISPSAESRRLFEQIEQLPDTPPATIPAKCDSFTHEDAHPGLIHEYRQVTVLRCGFSYRKIDDPEAFEDLVAEPLAQAVRIIEAHNGWIAAARGTGVLAYFGWPTADERAATHAVRAAIGLANQLPANSIGSTLSTGVHTGRIILRGETDSPDTIGLTTDIAVRLQASTRSGVIAISETTRRCIRDHFELSALPPLSMAEQMHPLSVWRVHRSESGASVENTQQRPPLVGRDAELNSLLDDWAVAQSGRCVVTVLVGEAGIGKTRLLQALHDKLGHPLLRETHCDPLMRQTPYQPITHFFRRHLDLPRNCTDAQIADKLAEHYSSFPHQGKHVIKPLQWLLARTDSHHEQTEEGRFNESERSQLIEAIANLLETSAKATPLLLVVEDLHWADPSTLTLLGSLAARLAESRIHFCLTMRSTGCLPGPLLDRARILQLRPLDLNASLQLTYRLAPPDRTSGDFALTIARQSEGNPMFIVELTYMLNDDELDDALPGKLQELISTRIEQAGEDRPLLRAAAVIGREFSLAHLAQLLGLPEQAVTGGLRRLMQRHLIERSSEDELSYRFTHALVHQVTYQSTTRSQRRELHKQFASLLMADANSDVDAGGVAHHLTESGAYAEAIGWWLKSGREAANMAAYVEAVNHFERGLHLLEHVPERGSLWETELELLVNLAYPLAITQGYYGIKSERLYRRALDITRDKPVQARQSLALMHSHWLGSSSRSSLRESRELAGRMIELAESANAKAFAALGHYLYGSDSILLGDFAAARTHLEETLTRLDRKNQETEHFLRNDQHFDITATGTLGWTAWFLGQVDGALRLTQRAVHMSEARHHPATLTSALVIYIFARICCRRPEEVAIAAKQLCAICRENGFRMWDDFGTLAGIWASAVASPPGETSKLDQAEAALQRAVALWPGGAAALQYILIDACLAKADDARAWKILAQFKKSMDSTGAAAFSVYGWLAEADLLTRGGQDGEPCLREAVEVAEQQRSPTLTILAWGHLIDDYRNRGFALSEDICRHLQETVDRCSGIDLAPAVAEITRKLSGTA